MTGRYLTDLADVLRAAGVAVVEQDGWQTRARSSGGYASGRPWCVMWHHTASSATADPASDAAYMSYNADAAPVANLLVARDGAVWVLAAGATNTNGKGNARTFTRGTVPADQMNTYAIGMEIQNTGVGQTYPAAQVDAAFTASLAMCAAYGLDPADVDLHATYAPDRKIDPATAAAVAGPWQPDSTNTSGTWSLADLRAELTRRASSPAPKPEPPQPSPDPEDDDMAFIITNRSSGEVALIYGDHQMVGLAGADLAYYAARFGDPIPTDPDIWQGFLDKSR